MTRTKSMRLKALAGGVAVMGVLAGSTAVAPVITAAAAPAAAVVVPRPVTFDMPVWSPLRAPARVSCARTNCPGPTHGKPGTIDFIDKDRFTLEGIFAVAPGIVHIGNISGANNCTVLTWVWIDHGNGRKSTYYHLQDVLVREGQRVTPRTRLGSMGHNGNPSCKVNYLHIFFKVNNVRVELPSMLACIGTRRISLPEHLGYARWDDMPANWKRPWIKDVSTPRTTNECMP